MKRITQSFIVDMTDYIAGGSCGHLMKKKWIDDELVDLGSEAAKLGAYFEYIFTKMVTGTGSLPKDGKIPQPGLYKTFKNKVAEVEEWNKKPDLKVKAKIPIPTTSDMLEAYQKAHKNAERLKVYFDLWGLEIVKAGVVLTKGRFDGTIDLICRCKKTIKWKNGMVWKKGYMFVMDLKYAATIDDKWNAMGWMWTDDQKKFHGPQAIQYSFITGLPFYFMVVSSTNLIDVKLFHIAVTEQQIEKHIATANDLEDKLKYYNDIGWEPRPDISKCGECPLMLTCPDKATYPQIETIEL